MRTRSIYTFILALVAVLLYSPVAGMAQEPETGVVWDTPMRVPSPEDTSSWFPDLAVDSEGRVHVVWNQTNHRAMNYPQPGEKINPDEFERVYYSVWDGQKWLPYNDIVPPQRDIIRNAITIDSQDRIHFVYGWFQAYHKQALASEAISAANWNSPRLVNSRQTTYMKDLAAFKDTLHLIYDDQGAELAECSRCADIFYRHSTDQGATWSAPTVLYPTGTGSSRAQLEVDRAGALYVTWDEGWDRLSGQGEPQYSVFTASQDGGNTWMSPTIVSYPSSGNSHLTVGADGQGGVMLVWQNPTLPQYYYMWSTDYGVSWSPPKNIQGVMTAPYYEFEMYDMATDSAGHIHLLINGRLSPDQESLHLYHLEWDGQSWSTAQPIYQGDWSAHYPHLVIDRGNQFYATWHLTAVDQTEAEAPYQVWFTHGQSSAPAETPVKIQPTATPLPTATSLPTPTPIPTPTIDPAALQAAVPAQLTDSLYTDYDDILILAQSLLPAAFIVGLVIIVVRISRR